MELIFKKISQNYPYSLLLLADETREAVDKYLFDSDVYIVKDQNQQTIAIFCLQEISQTMIEIKNIAVVESYRGIGVGSQILAYIKQLSKDNYRYLLVGTPDCSIAQINFYRKNGFVEFLIRLNFFIENYPQPIIEKGIQLKDMQVLKYNLQ